MKYEKRHLYDELKIYLLIIYLIKYILLIIAHIIELLLNHA